MSDRRAPVFDALRELLLEHPWGEVTLEAVAREAGVSRQTLYNAFGSRNGLARAYTLHLADALCDAIGATLAEHPQDTRGGLEEALRLFLAVAQEDPLIRRVRSGEAHPDLVRMVTVDAGPLLVHVTNRLDDVVLAAWPSVDPTVARTVSRTVARIAVSYISTPPETEEDVAPGLAARLAPRLG